MSMLVKVLQYLSPEKMPTTPQQMKICELIRSSLNFQEVTECDDDDFEELDYHQYFSMQNTDQYSQTLKAPLQTFSSYIKTKPDKLFTMTDQTNETRIESTTKHTRGPSKIKEIMSDLQASVKDDLQKIASEILKNQTKESIRESFNQLYSKCQLLNELQESSIVMQQSPKQQNNKDEFQQYKLNKSQSSQQKQIMRSQSSSQLQNPIYSYFSEPSYQIQNSPQEFQQEFQPVCQKTQESDKKTEVQQPKKKPKQRRKKSRIPKNLKYYLDIIEEQSNDQFTPDKSQLDETEDLECIQSLPCFANNNQYSQYQQELQQFSRTCMKQVSSGKKERYPQQQNMEVKSFRNTITQQSSDSNNSSINYTKNLTLQDLDDILRSIDAFRTYNSNKEEEAILASWNKLCVEIIKKNLLPVTLNIERIQNQYKTTSSKRIGFKRRINTHRSEITDHQDNSTVNIHTCNSVLKVIDQNVIDHSSSDIQVEVSQDLNFQFSPNFSDICKRIQFSSGSYHQEDKTQKFKQPSFLQYKNEYH
ncbi:hypothetical protein pb186bvf_008277 [Paramecium bursaria]